MVTTRKFYRTVFTYEVLTEEPITNETWTLAQINSMCYEGHASGHFLDTKEEVLDGPATANKLAEQGSDPEFFGLDENGNEVEQ